MIKFLYLFTGLFSLNLCMPFLAISQQTAVHPKKNDTAHLKEVIVTGFQTNRSLYLTPASIVQLKAADLDRYTNVSLLPALNTVPGIVMEERSPGSYRISIRGSSIRSPFGVRNIKVYLDDIPFTDAGGNTNLNLLDFNTLGKVEIIKGPTGSIYGSGAGGTILLYSKNFTNTGFHSFAGYEAGSYGLRSFNAGLNQSDQHHQIRVSYNELKSAGYRQNTAMARKEFYINEKVKISDHESLALTAFYADLQYQTPGALTLSEYTINPSQARPATKSTLSAVSQKAGIYRKELYTGISHTYSFTPHWENTSSAFITGDQFNNPFITNYEREVAVGYGFRTTTKVQASLLDIPIHLLFGGEYQFQYAGDKNYKNKAGIPDSLTSDNELKNSQLLAFLQLGAELPFGILVDAGLSYNRISYHVLNLFSHPVRLTGNSYKPVLVPRIGILKKINQYQSVYISLSGGFSPPANAEALETTGFFNTALKAENSITLEAGTKGAAFSGLLDYDLTVFKNNTSNTIVQRQRAGGGIYFINEGSTVEKGLELRFSLNLFRQQQGIVRFLKLINSLTINRFYFLHETIGHTLVSGNPLTGTAPYLATLGVDAGLLTDFTVNYTSRYVDRISLNDANTAHAQAYIVNDTRFNYRKALGKKVQLRIFAGSDNIFNKKYSLGNDLNGFGNRYYNAAPRRSFYTGLSVSY